MGIHWLLRFASHRHEKTRLAYRWDVIGLSKKRRIKTKPVLNLYIAHSIVFGHRSLPEKPLKSRWIRRLSGKAIGRAAASIHRSCTWSWSAWHCAPANGGPPHRKAPHPNTLLGSPAAISAATTSPSGGGFMTGSSVTDPAKAHVFLYLASHSGGSTVCLSKIDGMGLVARADEEAGRVLLGSRAGAPMPADFF